MKLIFKNNVNPLAMLLMALAMAFTISCESKEEKQAKAEAEAAARARAAAKVVARADAARAEAKAARAGAEAEMAAEEAMLKAKADCPDKKIGEPKTVEAVFLKFNNDDVDEGYEQFACYAYFRLSNGEEIILFCGDTDINVRDGLKKGIKVSITYQKTQRWNHDDFNPSESACYEDNNLQSVKLLPPPEIQYGSPLTYEGQTYKTVIIDKQTWMAENLNYNAEGSKCYDNKEENCQKYGKLYDWATAMKACPSGWHLPNEDEWKVLVSVGGMGGSNKFKATSGWKDGNGLDEYGFAALSGGQGRPNGKFSYAGYDGSWWSSSEGGSKGKYRNLGEDGWSIGSKNKDELLSVRCVKD